MSVRGLFETHLTVADLKRSVAFYRDIVGLTVALELPERGAAFHWIGQPGQAMLGLWSIGSAPMGMRLHVAFDMALADVQAAPDRLQAQGIQPLSFFGALAPIAMAFVGLDGAEGFEPRPLHHPELLPPDSAVGAVARAQAVLFLAAAMSAGAGRR